MPGKLILIGTPIGNLGDLSPRAIAAIRSCERLFCEDTRHTRKLLDHTGISVPLESLHDHNEDSKTNRLLESLSAGATLGLVSDAGLPLLSDPGYALVRAARDSGIQIEPVPGPFAAALALIASGIPPLPFAFFGFAPHRHSERLAFYQRVASAGMTALVYESPQRIVESLRDARTALGDVEATVAREMTKLHEEFLHGTLTHLIESLERRESIRGEITVVLGAREEVAEVLPDAATLAAQLEELTGRGMRRVEAMKLLADRYSVRKSEIYGLLLGPDRSPG